MYFILYFVVVAVIFPFMYRAIYRYHQREFPILTWKDSDRVTGFWAGLFVSCYWPLVLPLMLVYFGILALVKVIRPLLAILEK